MTAIQSPIDLSSATRVGPRVYRKQVLAKRTIDYPMRDGTTRQVAFDDEYLRDLAAAYNDGAYELVPFQLADARNRHNEDPRNYAGKVIGAEVTDDGLDVILELSADAAELVEKTGRKLGVSARIKESLQHVDGRTFKRAVRHVLGTLDPRMTNLAPWEPIDLAADDDHDLIDLSGLHYQQEGSTMPRIIDLSQLDPEDAERLERLAEAGGIDLSGAEVEASQPNTPAPEPAPSTTPDPEQPNTPAPQEADELEGEEGDEPGDEPEGITDDELEALIDAELAGVELSSDVDDDLDLSGADDLEGDDLDLAAGLIGVDGDERQADRVALADARFKLAAQELARNGVPPHLIDLAQPILSLTDDQADELDLSSPATGEAIDVRGIVRGMLDAVAGTIDLSGETGYGHETEPDQQLSDLAGRWSEYLENN